MKGRRSGSDNLFEINCKKGRVFDLSRDKSNRDSDLRSEKRKKIVFIQRKKRMTSESVLPPDTHNKLTSTIKLLHESLVKYGPDSIALSFNGGKDCTLVLDLFEKARQDFYKQNPHVIKSKLKVLYVTLLDPFEEVEEFVTESCKHYDLELYKLGNGMKSALKEFLILNPEIKAIVIGTRRTDPFANEYTDYMPTDKDWPSILRIHPILDWIYHDVWQIIRHYNIPYCKLYKHGYLTRYLLLHIRYTSLGNLKDTTPNPFLWSKDENKYLPAYMLSDASQERLGRIKRV